MLTKITVIITNTVRNIWKNLDVDKKTPVIITNTLRNIWVNIDVDKKKTLVIITYTLKTFE